MNYDVELQFTNDLLRNFRLEIRYLKENDDIFALDSTEYTMRTLLYGTKGTIICDNTSPTMQLYTLYENDISVNPTPQIIDVVVNNHNADKEFAVFADSIVHNTPVEMDAVQGAKTVEACLAIVESARTGKPVQPNYNFT